MLTLLSTAGGFAATATGMADHTQLAYEQVHLVLQPLQSFKVFALAVILERQLMVHALRHKSLSMCLLMLLGLGTLWVMLLLLLRKHLLGLLLLLLWQLLQLLLWTPLRSLQHLLWEPMLLQWHLLLSSLWLLWHLPVWLHC